MHHNGVEEGCWNLSGSIGQMEKYGLENGSVSGNKTMCLWCDCSSELYCDGLVHHDMQDHDNSSFLDVNAEQCMSESCLFVCFV